MATIVVFFIVGLSVVLSFDWTNGGFRPDAAMTILFAILVAAIIYIAFQGAARASSWWAVSLRACPACQRAIPADAVPCPYCGQRLS